MVLFTLYKIKLPGLIDHDAIYRIPSINHKFINIIRNRGLYTSLKKVIRY